MFQSTLFTTPELIERHKLYDSLLDETHSGDMVSIEDATRMGCKYRVDEEGFLEVRIPKSYASAWFARTVVEKRPRSRSPSPVSPRSPRERQPTLEEVMERSPAPAPLDVVMAEPEAAAPNKRPRPMKAEETRAFFAAGPRFALPGAPAPPSPPPSPTLVVVDAGPDSPVRVHATEAEYRRFYSFVTRMRKGLVRVIPDEEKLASFGIVRDGDVMTIPRHTKYVQTMRVRVHPALPQPPASPAAGSDSSPWTAAGSDSDSGDAESLQFSSDNEESTTDMAPRVLRTGTHSPSHVFQRARFAFIDRLATGKMKKMPTADKLAKYGVTVVGGQVIIPDDYKRGAAPVVVMPRSTVTAHTAAHNVVLPPERVEMQDDIDMGAPVTFAALSAFGAAKKGKTAAKWRGVKNVLKKLGATEAAMKHADFDVAKWLNSNFSDAMIVLFADHKEGTWATIEKQSWNTFLMDCDTISTVVDQYPPLTQRVSQDTKDSILFFRQEIKAEADIYNSARREATMVYSQAALKAWLLAHYNVETSLELQYFLAYEHCPVRGEMQGLKRATGPAPADAAGKKNAWYEDDAGRIVIEIEDFKTMGSRIKSKPYVIPADLSEHILAAQKDTTTLFPKDMAKRVGNLFRSKGIAFPFGPTQTVLYDVPGFRHTLATYRNSDTFKGPDSMRGTHLATLMLHTRKASETTYRHGQVFLPVPGFNDDGSPKATAPPAPARAPAAPKRARAPAAPKPDAAPKRARAPPRTRM